MGISLAPVRVAQLCPYSLSVPGGVQAQVLGLARAQRALGHDVAVLAPCDGPPPEAGVRVVGRSVPIVANGSVAHIAVGVMAARRALAEVAEGDYDVLHLHEPLVPGANVATLLAHPALCVGTFHRSGGSRAYQLLRPAARAAANRLQGRFAVSEEAALTAKEALGGHYEVIPNGIELGRLTTASPWPTDAPTIFFLGRHEPRKGLALCLEAFAGLRADGVAARLWVAGEGPETERLMREYRECPGVEWLGAIGEEEKESRLGGASILCAPSLGGESFGVVLLEAMAAGTAIVASDLPAYRKVVRRDLQGLLVPPGDVGALTSALRRLIEDPALAKSLARAAYDRAKEYSMMDIARRYLDHYDRLLGG